MGVPNVQHRQQTSLHFWSRKNNETFDFCTFWLLWKQVSTSRKFLSTFFPSLKQNLIRTRRTSNSGIFWWSGSSKGLITHSHSKTFSFSMSKLQLWTANDPADSILLTPSFGYQVNAVILEKRNKIRSFFDHTLYIVDFVFKLLGLWSSCVEFYPLYVPNTKNKITYPFRRCGNLQTAYQKTLFGLVCIGNCLFRWNMETHFNDSSTFFSLIHHSTKNTCLDLCAPAVRYPDSHRPALCSYLDEWSPWSTVLHAIITP